jgi:P-loop ATPase protein family
VKPVVLGGPDAQLVVSCFEAVGRAVELLPPASPSAEALRARDGAGRYILVHVGADDGEPDGSFSRAHHRIAASEAAALAERLRPRERMLVRCVAFGYKHGPPPVANFLLDVRSLPNPFWDPALRDLDGRDPAVRSYVLADPRAIRMLDDVETLLRSALPLAFDDERYEYTVAFGCTGGRHRSLTLAVELASRLRSLEGVDVTISAPALDGAG